MEDTGGAATAAKGKEGERGPGIVIPNSRVSQGTREDSLFQVTQ